MHIWVFAKDREPRSVNKKDSQRMFETMNWFDNPELELNEYQKQFKELVEKKEKAQKAKAAKRGK